MKYKPNIVFTKDGKDLACAHCEKRMRRWQKRSVMTYRLDIGWAYEWYHWKCLKKLVLPRRFSLERNPTRCWPKVVWHFNFVSFSFSYWEFVLWRKEVSE